MSTGYTEFASKFKESPLNKLYIVYNDEVIDFCKAHGFTDLERFYCDLLRRSYPEEVLSWAKDSLYYMYECNLPIVNASLKHTPDFLLK